MNFPQNGMKKIGELPTRLNKINLLTNFLSGAEFLPLEWSLHVISIDTRDCSATGILEIS